MSNIKMSGNGRIVIDGKEFRGNNIQISGNKVIVDGVTQDGDLVGDVNITVHGDVESIENTHGYVKCNNAGKVKTTHGEVSVTGDIKGDVDTTHGNVRAGKITGSVKTTFGDVSR